MNLDFIKPAWCLFLHERVKTVGNPNNSNTMNTETLDESGKISFGETLANYTTIYTVYTPN